MLGSTKTLRRLAVSLLAASALISSPAAYAFDGPPDAIDRYLAPVATPFDGPPDAIDRWTAHEAPLVQSSIQGSPDALDRYEANHALAAEPTIQGSPDAIDRFTAAQALMTQPAIQSSPDALDRYLGRTAAPQVVTVGGGFAWSEFGIGAGAMLGAVVLLLGLGLGALTVRHRGGQLRTS